MSHPDQPTADDREPGTFETREYSVVTPGTGASMQQLAKLSETLLAMAAGDFSVRAERTYKRDPFDVLSYLVNNTADELESAIARVERQNRELESILDAMGEGIILLDDEGHVRRANKSMLDMLGVDRESAVLNQAVSSLLTQASQKEANRLLLDDSGNTARVEMVFDTESGGVTFPVSWSAVVDDQGTTTGFIMAVHDDRELRIVRARAELSDRMTAMGAMAAGVAHEINNPLAYVAANIDYVVSLIESAEFTEGEAHEALVDATDGVRRVREIVADLNTFSRADDESKSIVPISQTVESALKMLTAEIRHRAELTVDLPPMPKIEANEARLIQVFVNIIINALQALDERPRDERRLGISAHEEEGIVYVEIADNAGGISEENLPRVFDAFFTTKPVGKGTGLGLAISHQTVVNLGGRIDIDTTVGEGTTFTVVIPTKGRRVTPRRAPAPPAEPSPSAKMPRLLVVDDEPALAKALRRLLAPGHDVTVVTEPEQALELLHNEEFDAVLCDVMMPRVSGIEIYLEIESARPELAERFIFMTGGAFTASAQDFLERVANPCLRKPFDLEELQRQLVELDNG